MKMNELYWLTGIIEGEGYIGTIKNKYPTIVVKMTDEDIIQRVSYLFHNSYRNVYRNRPRLTPNLTEAKPIYQTEVTGHRAAGLLMTMYTLLGTRRRNKVKDVLTIWRDPNIRKINKSYDPVKAQAYYREYKQTRIR